MQKPLQKIAVAGASLLLIAFSSPLAFAEDSGSGSTSSGGSADNSSSTTVEVQSGSKGEHTSVTTHQSSTSDDSSTDSTGDSGKLSSGHLKACENRQAAINKILTRIVTRGQKQLTLFSQIAERVENFKTTKNLTAANYDQLLSTLATDKAKATADLTAMQTNVTLDCNSTDPHGMVNNFKTQLQTEIKDLKTYKTDVKNLIVAVKTAAGTSTDSNSSSTDNTGGNQ